MQKRQFILFGLWMVSIGCANMPGKPISSTRGMPLDISGYCNTTYQSPWPNHPPFGYRDWFEGDMNYQRIPFDIPDNGQVLTLKPDSTFEVDLSNPIYAKGIALLCSGSFLYDEPLIFTVEIETTDDVITRELKAYEWYSWAAPSKESPSYVVQTFPIFVDGKDATGQAGYTQASFSGKVKKIRIIHDQNKDSRQHLMIAAITLLQRYSPTITERYMKTSFPPIP